MFPIKSFVTICTLFIVTILESGNNLSNCEPTKSHHIKLVWPPRPLEEVNENRFGQTIETISTFDHMNSDATAIDLLISTEKNELRSTDRTILLPSSPITSSELDYYPQITGWCADCCEEDEIFVKSEQKCLKRSFIDDKCISSEQCIVPQSTCLRNMCVCIDYFVDYSRNKCTPIHNTAIEIYKITMIFASSCLALILLIFLACILRKSYCPADSSHHQGANRSTINDLFTIYPGTSGSPNELFSSLTPAEKPPSYNETMRMINQEIGTPPPAYHNIFYTETSSSILAQPTSSSNQQNSGIVNSNEPSSTSSSSSSSSSHPSQSSNCNNGLAPATSTQLTTINAQNHNLYSSSLSQSPSAIAPQPSAPLIAVFNKGRVNTAFDCDS